jgi:hypothetical protein
VEDIRALLRDGSLVSDPKSRESVRSLVSTYFDGERVAQAELLAQLDRVDTSAGILPAVTAAAQ